MQPLAAIRTLLCERIIVDCRDLRDEFLKYLVSLIQLVWSSCSCPQRLRQPQVKQAGLRLKKRQTTNARPRLQLSWKRLAVSSRRDQCTLLRLQLRWKRLAVASCRDQRRCWRNINSMVHLKHARITETIRDVTIPSINHRSVSDSRLANHIDIYKRRCASHDRRACSTIAGPYARQVLNDVDPQRHQCAKL